MILKITQTWFKFWLKIMYTSRSNPVLSRFICKKRAQSNYGFCNSDLRRWCNLILTLALMTLILVDTTLTGYKWGKCRTNISLWAHIGGLLVGGSMGYFVFDKYKESWALEEAQRRGMAVPTCHRSKLYNSFETLKKEVKCCNYTNCVDGMIFLLFPINTLN